MDRFRYPELQQVRRTEWGHLGRALLTSLSQRLTGIPAFGFFRGLGGGRLSSWDQPSNGAPHSMKLALGEERVVVKILGKAGRPLRCFALGHDAIEETDNVCTFGGVAVDLPQGVCGPILDVRACFERHDPLEQANATLIFETGIQQIAIQTEWHAGKHIFSGVDVVQGDRFVLPLAAFESPQLRLQRPALTLFSGGSR